MKIIDEMPKSGQFIAVWEHKGKIWSDTLKYDENGDLVEFSNRYDNFSTDWLEPYTENMKFIILDS